MVNRRPEETDRDLIDVAMEAPIVGAGLTRLQRVVGPSCLLSLVLLLIFIVVTRTWLHLPWPVMLFVAAIVWMLVLSVLVRWNNPNPHDDL